MGQARQHKGGNFYIDITDVMAAAKVQRLHQLMKCDIMPEGEPLSHCTLCDAVPIPEDLELLPDLSM